MYPTPIGLIVVAIGIHALFVPTHRMFLFALLFSLVGAGAAVNMPSLGGASIVPSPLFTGFIVLRILLTRQRAWRVVTALAPGSAGFWLLATVAYGILVIFFVAPFFYNSVLVYPIARTDEGGGIFSLEPLRFTSGNITQSIYALGEIALYGCTVTLLRSDRISADILKALVALAVAHIAVSILDIATFATGTSFVIDWLRQGGYTLWQDNSVAGLKRISGLFQEASIYSIYGMTIAGILYGLYINDYRPRLTGVLLVATVGLLILSTSSTAYVSLALTGSILLVFALKQQIVSGNTKGIKFLALATGIGLLVVMLIVTIAPDSVERATEVYNEMVANKLDSDSGQDRSQLNSNAFANFVEAYGLGMGIGSVRTSSFIATLLSNAGFLGSLFFVVFMLQTLYRRSENGRETREVQVVRAAAAAGLVSALIANCVSFHVFDLGPLFYILAAICNSWSLQRARRTTVLA